MALPALPTKDALRVPVERLLFPIAIIGRDWYFLLSRDSVRFVLALSRAGRHITARPTGEEVLVLNGGMRVPLVWTNVVYCPFDYPRIEAA
jgi:hypothetical protein